MKNLTKLFLGCLIIFAVASCKKTDGSGNGGTNGTAGSMSGKVDGKDWSAATAVDAIKAGGSLNIAGTGNGGQVNITILNYSGPKSYQIGGNVLNFNVNATYSTVTLPPVGYLTTGGLGSGNVTITKEEGGYVEGTFNFLAKTETNGKSVNVTDGKFRIKLK